VSKALICFKIDKKSLIENFEMREGFLKSRMIHSPIRIKYGSLDFYLWKSKAHIKAFIKF
jgi:hypothetical protein